MVDLTDLRGNIVFYRSYGPSWQERMSTRLVQWATHGPYVHCEVVFGQNKGRKYFPYLPQERWLTIGAHADGIHMGIVPANKNDQWEMAPTKNINGSFEEPRLSSALLWAEKHLGVSYGVLDIVDQVIDFLFPWNKLHISEEDHYDCSNFAVACLIRAGVELPSSFTEPYNVSPNDLAEWYGLLPERQRIRL